MSRTVVERCAVCAGPLDGVSGATVVACAYCGSENRMVSRAQEQGMARAAQGAAAAAEARRLATDEDLAKRADAMRAAYERASERALRGGGAGAAEDALRHLEGWLRLEYAPTLQLYRGMPPDTPGVAESLAQIDAQIDHVVASAAASLGVAYRPVRERLGG